MHEASVNHIGGHRVHDARVQAADVVARDERLVADVENALERAVILTNDRTIGPASLPERITQRKSEPLVAERTPPNPTLEAIERAYILWVLQGEGGNKTRAAEALGIDPSTLYRKLSRYGVEPV